MKKKTLYYILTGAVSVFLLSRLDFTVGPNPNLSGLLGVPQITTETVIAENLFNFFFTTLIIGLCAFLGLIALVQGIYSNARDYKLWSLYLFSNALFFFAGLDYNFKMDIITGALRLGWLEFRRPWGIPAQYIVVIAYLSFIMSFLKLRLHDYALHKVITYLQITLGIITIVAFWSVTYYLHTIYLDVFIFLIVLVLFGIFVRISNKDIPQKGLLMIGSIGVLICGLIATTIDQLSLSDPNSFFLNPFNIYSIGVIFELVFFSLALSQRTIQIEIENQNLQKKYSQELELEIATRTKEIEEKTKQLEEERLHKITSDFELKIAEIEMSALRSQMNPHFIFNCLNSIKLYSIENDSKAASEYLTKFSRLIRLVLENSRSEKVTLENELETLKLYMDMEAMRFKEKVNYSIIIDKKVDTPFIEIPPLLIQPFVENAIWHGLMHKELGGNITIDLQNIDDKILKISVTDDGVGRKKSLELQSKTATRNKSYGMQATNERVALINHVYKTDTKIEIIDLEDINKNPIGTRVIIEIPLMYD